MMAGVLVDANIFLKIALPSELRIGNYFTVANATSREITACFFECMDSASISPVVLPEIYLEVGGRMKFREKVLHEVLSDFQFLMYDEGYYLASEHSVSEIDIEKSKIKTYKKGKELLEKVQLLMGIELKSGSLHLAKKKFCAKFPSLLNGARKGALNENLLCDYVSEHLESDEEKIMFLYLALTVMLQPHDESKKFPLNTEARISNVIVDFLLILASKEACLPLYTADICLQHRADFVMSYFGLNDMIYLIDPKKEAEAAVLEDLELRMANEGLRDLNNTICEDS
jgi:hypothetical protein